MRLCSCLLSLLLIPTLAPAASREIVELQRDVATLQDQIRTLSSGTNEKLTAITVLLQQTLEATNNTSKSVAVLESRVNDRLEKQTASAPRREGRQDQTTGPQVGCGRWGTALPTAGQPPREASKITRRRALRSPTHRGPAGGRWHGRGQGG